MFMSLDTTTDWHGEFIEDDGIIKLKFNYKGDVDRLKAATLFRVAPLVYRGVDYAQRVVEMTSTAEFVWCAKCRLWRQIE